VKEERRQLKKQSSMGNFHSYSESESMPLAQSKDNHNASRDFLKSQKGSLIVASPNHRSVPKITFLNNNNPVQYLTDIPATKKSYVSPDYAHPF
jgi:CMP-N-acetylneuraminic acid synthetase